MLTTSIKYQRALKYIPFGPFERVFSKGKFSERNGVVRKNIQIYKTIKSLQSWSYDQSKIHINDKLEYK